MEHYYQRFFDYVAEELILPEADKTSIRQLFKPFFVPKNTIIEPAGGVPHYHNFIVSGYMRNFRLVRDDNEITTDLNDGSRFFTSYFHFMNRTVSNENLHCITDCELLRISRDDVELGAQNSQTQKALHNRAGGPVKFCKNIWKRTKDASTTWSTCRPKRVTKNSSGRSPPLSGTFTYAIPLSLIVLELYLLAQRKQNKALSLFTSILIFGCTIVMGIGIFGATLGLWLPQM